MATRVGSYVIFVPFLVVTIWLSYSCTRDADGDWSKAFSGFAILAVAYAIAAVIGAFSSAGIWFALTRPFVIVLASIIGMTIDPKLQELGAVLYYVIGGLAAAMAVGVFVLEMAVWAPRMLKTRNARN
jgi:hypothetical protein